MKVLPNTMLIIILQNINISSQHIVYPKLYQHCISVISQWKEKMRLYKKRELDHVITEM